MRYAILSDVHGRCHKLDAVLADARTRRARRLISLGDVGGNDCLSRLNRGGVQAAFGNYEVSGWRQVAPRHQAWIRHWPPVLAGDSFLAVHAVPWRPEGLHTVEDYGQWLKRTGRSWRALFPYMNEDEDHLWASFAELEAQDRTILFHGHTHQQAIWQWTPAGRLQQVADLKFELEAQHRYIVGVGSVGLPEDPCWAAYALYDSDAGCIELIRLDGP